MPSTLYGQGPNLPHVTPIACESCGGKAHLVLLTADAIGRHHLLHHASIWTFECTVCGHIAQHCIED
jgi:hypothetical protein